MLQKYLEVTTNLEINLFEWINGTLTLPEKCPYSEFFWSVFSRIQTEYREMRVSLRIQSEYGKIRTRKTQNMDNFYAV